MSPSYSVRIEADVVSRVTVHEHITVEAASARDAMREVWRERQKHLAVRVPEGYEVAAYRAEVEGDVAESGESS